MTYSTGNTYCFTYNNVFVEAYAEYCVSYPQAVART